MAVTNEGSPEHLTCGCEYWSISHIYERPGKVICMLNSWRFTLPIYWSIVSANLPSFYGEGCTGLMPRIWKRFWVDGVKFIYIVVCN